jgi:hypothetical protein
MTGLEGFGVVAGMVGFAEVVKMVLEKLLSKKKEHISNSKDEFELMKQRLELAENEIDRGQRESFANTRRISKLYTFLADLTLMTCSKQTCPMRDIIAIDFAAIENDIEKEYKETVENNKDDGK